MPKLSALSLQRLSTADPRLRAICLEAIKIMDFTVLEAHRGKAAQDAAVKAGNSQTPWPTSKHNKLPSLAIDLAPYPVDWSDATKNIERFCLLAGVMVACAHHLGYAIRWGGDWDRDFDTRDENFRDRPHFELVG